MEEQADTRPLMRRLLWRAFWAPLKTLFWMNAVVMNAPRPREIDGRRSYLRNCLIRGRPRDGVLFRINGASLVVAYLDGYAIVPVEDYVQLLPESQRAALQRLIPKSGPTTPSLPPS